MPLALAVMGACARLAALSKPWATEALACAEDLAVFAKSIPMKDPKGFGMDSVDAVWRTHAIDNPDPPDDNDALAGAEEDGEEVLVSPIPTLAKILVGSTAEALELSESFFSAKMADGPVPQPEPEPEDAIARHEKGSSAARPPGNKKKKKKKKQDDRDDAALNADEIDAIFGF